MLIARSSTSSNPVIIRMFGKVLADSLKCLTAAHQLNAIVGLVLAHGIAFQVAVVLGTSRAATLAVYAEQSLNGCLTAAITSAGILHAGDNQIELQENKPITLPFQQSRKGP
ncbi:hypothetical protein ACL9RI_17200 [Janthinobacterium sp. Mn2066]|uniref:hypothetical protein n=1 Tax=Janthinobacterium sp. Mn2066 TaxID=3395264 RepID=UPI003BD9F353